MRRSPTTIHPRSCAQCGRRFRPRTNAQLNPYCSRICSGKARRSRTDQQFLSNFDRSGGASSCHPWLGSGDKSGYGRGHYGGKKMLSHRAVWIIFNGPIPNGLKVCHTCDNPPCGNISHLFLGTQADNMRDCRDKGRLHILRSGSKFVAKTITAS